MFPATLPVAAPLAVTPLTLAAARLHYLLLTKQQLNEFEREKPRQDCYLFPAGTWFNVSLKDPLTGGHNPYAQRS